MQLKLAEYNADGKFERFLELGKDFGYFGDYIQILPEELLEFEYNITCPDFLKDRRQPKIFTKDKKDPLNRFNGLFDGRTYGNGRFVLIVNFEDNVYRKIYYNGYEDVFIYKMDDFLKIEEEWKEFGNLHENPELYNNLNNQIL